MLLLPGDATGPDGGSNGGLSGEVLLLLATGEPVVSEVNGWRVETEPGLGDTVGDDFCFEAGGIGEVSLGGANGEEAGPLLLLATGDPL